MTARVLDGRAVASRVWRELSERTAVLRSRTGAEPRLAIVRFAAEHPPADRRPREPRADEPRTGGQDRTDRSRAEGPAAVYAASLERAARSVGVEPHEILPPAGIALSDLTARIGALNRDPQVAGIVVAQPVPAHLEASAVLALIDPAKDVDGATPLNAGRVARGDDAFVPATALAVMAILRANEIPIAGRRAVVIGRSAIVGRPVASLLLAADATVTICHRRTHNLARETRRAELLVVAAGEPGLIRADMVSRSAVVIDCGINTTPDGIVGDIDYAAVRPVVSAITPVPGGVGPVTTMMLLEQTVRSAERAAEDADPLTQRFVVTVPDRPSRRAGSTRR